MIPARKIGRRAGEVKRRGRERILVARNRDRWTISNSCTFSRYAGEKRGMDGDPRGFRSVRLDGGLFGLVRHLGSLVCLR